MPVTKTTRECYEVRDGRHEWANITLHCWHRLTNAGTPNEDTYHCGEITIQSSFGTWGYIWTACGVPFKRFLAKVEFDYAFGKFMGSGLHRFDGEATAREVSRWITEGRRRSLMSKHQAREAWDAFGDVRSMAESSANDFGHAMMDVARSLDSDHPLRESFADPCGWPNVTRYDSQAVGFWKHIWPLFVAELRAETECSNECKTDGALA